MKNEQNVNVTSGKGYSSVTVGEFTIVTRGDEVTVTRVITGPLGLRRAVRYVEETAVKAEPKETFTSPCHQIN